MSSSIPWYAALSQALVAFTIEFDNAAELRMQHRTSRYTSQAGARGPWLISLAMWLNSIQFVPEEGVTVRELERLARTETNLNGLQRWGYVTIEPATGRERMIRLTTTGRRASEVWRAVFPEIAERWETRFGKEQVEALGSALRDVAASNDGGLPDCLPVVGYGLTSKLKRWPKEEEAGSAVGNSLAARLAKALLLFAVEYERESAVSLAIGANVLRTVGEDGVRSRDLPEVSGVAKETCVVATGWLVRHGFATWETVGRGKLLRLSGKGEKARAEHHRLVEAIEARWRERYGAEVMSRVARVSRSISGERLFEGLDPKAENWRAKVPQPKTLPWFPVVTHRGGYPDGS